MSPSSNICGLCNSRLLQSAFTDISFYPTYMLINGWKANDSKCYWTKKQIEPFHKLALEYGFKVLSLYPAYKHEAYVGISTCDSQAPELPSQKVTDPPRPSFKRFSTLSKVLPVIYRHCMEKASVGIFMLY